MKRIIFIGLSGFLVLSACSGIAEEVASDEVKHVVISAEDFKNEIDNRTQLNISPEGAIFSWAVNDTVGIFPNTGAQVYFPMEEGAGTNTASFTGGGWALKNGYTYAAYFPFIGNYYVNKEQLPLLYTGQKQQGSASTAHLGFYDYMAAPPEIPSDGYVNFHFEHLGCLIQLRLTVPVVATFRTLALNCEMAIFITKATLGLIDSNYTFAPSECCQRLELELADIASTEIGQELTFYMMMAPVEMTGKTVLVVLTDVDGKEYKGKLESKDMQGGYSYDFEVVLQENLDNFFAEGIEAPSFGTEENI